MQSCTLAGRDDLEYQVKMFYSESISNMCINASFYNGYSRRMKVNFLFFFVFFLLGSQSGSIVVFYALWFKELISRE